MNERPPLDASDKVKLRALDCYYMPVGEPVETEVRLVLPELGVFYAVGFHFAYRIADENVTWTRGP